MLPSAVTWMLPPAVVRLPSTATRRCPRVVPAATVIVPAPVVCDRVRGVEKHDRSRRRLEQKGTAVARWSRVARCRAHVQSQ